MLDKVLKFKRLLVWYRRIVLSEFYFEVGSFEHNNKEHTILWIFDHSGPDGSMLRPDVIKYAAYHGYSLASFGPRSLQLSQTWCYCTRFVELIKWGQDGFLSKKIAGFCYTHSPEKYLVGSMKSYYYTLIRSSLTRPLIEMQHGFLDDSYFPMECDLFIARYSESIAYLESIGVPIDSSIVPLVTKSYVLRNLDDYTNLRVILLSKNPGGGCDPISLSKFERLVMRAVYNKGLSFEFRRHPRDNLLKFIARHALVEIRSFIFAPIMTEKRVYDRTLYIGSYTTALFELPRVGDLIMNVSIGCEDIVQQSQYRDLTVGNFSLLTFDDDMKVLRRVT